MPEDPSKTRQPGNSTDDIEILDDADVTEEAGDDEEIPISEAPEGHTQPDGLLNILIQIDRDHPENPGPTTQVETPGAHSHFYTILLKDLREAEQTNRELVTITADRGAVCKFCGIEISVAKAIQFAETHKMLSTEEASELTSALASIRETTTPKRTMGKHGQKTQAETEALEILNTLLIDEESALALTTQLRLFGTEARQRFSIAEAIDFFREVDLLTRTGASHLTEMFKRRLQMLGLSMADFKRKFARSKKIKEILAEPAHAKKLEEIEIAVTPATKSTEFTILNETEEVTIREAIDSFFEQIDVLPEDEFPIRDPLIKKYETKLQEAGLTEAALLARLEPRRNRLDQRPKISVYETLRKAIETAPKSPRTFFTISVSENGGQQKRIPVLVAIAEAFSGGNISKQHADNLSKECIAAMRKRAKKNGGTEAKIRFHLAWAAKIMDSAESLRPPSTETPQERIERALVEAEGEIGNGDISPLILVLTERASETITKDECLGFTRRAVDAVVSAEIGLFSAFKITTILERLRDDEEKRALLNILPFSETDCEDAEDILFPLSEQAAVSQLQHYDNWDLRAFYERWAGENADSMDILSVSFGSLVIEKIRASIGITAIVSAVVAAIATTYDPSNKSGWQNLPTAKTVRVASTIENPDTGATPFISDMTTSVPKDILPPAYAQTSIPSPENIYSSTTFPDAIAVAAVDTKATETFPENLDSTAPAQTTTRSAASLEEQETAIKVIQTILGDITGEARVAKSDIASQMQALVDKTNTELEKLSTQIAQWRNTPLSPPRPAETAAIDLEERRRTLETVSTAVPLTLTPEEQTATITTIQSVSKDLAIKTRTTGTKLASWIQARVDRTKANMEKLTEQIVQWRRTPLSSPRTAEVDAVRMSGRLSIETMLTAFPQEPPQVAQAETPPEIQPKQPVPPQPTTTEPSLEIKPPITPSVQPAAPVQPQPAPQPPSPEKAEAPETIEVQIPIVTAKTATGFTIDSSKSYALWKANGWQGAFTRTAEGASFVIIIPDKKTEKSYKAEIPTNYTSAQKTVSSTARLIEKQAKK
jgi:hypothetical protein